MTRGGGVSFDELLRGRVPPGAIDRLAAYGELLEHWSSRHNLICVANRTELVERHILESLAPIRDLPRSGALADIGSGAGLPGVPLLCAMDQWFGLLIEPRQKRWAFLSLVIRELGLNARAVRVRYEAAEEGRFDLITARAVGCHESLLAWAAGRLNPAGAVALWATSSEVQSLGGLLGWSMVSSPLPGLERGRLILFKVCST